MPLRRLICSNSEPGLSHFWIVECWDCGPTVMAGIRAVCTDLDEAGSARGQRKAKRHALIPWLERREGIDGWVYWLVKVR